ncbi:hypothetical protein HPC49_08750 [Pyxidicoccus fallax]|uniref:Lipoprotein n=1 Tax=Pyxidicoccus fallax TaxID=394095 RepID=A0A848L4Q4_9BACT|nr:hypothetical protein [Pyxidicoccus fallax]NMO13437.1 hypothetical protein [Pyxidicoccus fallax]NPC78333.1 hypothetical protein [Pyxidicoccus fallax]
MKSRLKKVVLMAGALLPLVAVARSVPASSGRPEFWSDGTCFRVAYSTIINDCSTRKSFEIPLSIDSSGDKTVVVAAQVTTTSGLVGCAAVGMNREFTQVYGGTRKWIGPPINTTQLITLTDAHVPSRGYLYVSCHLDNGGRVNSVDYNP